MFHRRGIHQRHDDSEVLMTIDRAAARHFLYAEGRLLEQRVYEALFERGHPADVVRAVAAYQNDDGGFGHGLEPDKRCPASQPLDVAIALERLASVKAEATELVRRACDFLVTVADETGAVPVVLPSIAGYPRASHWSRDHYPPGLNPTASMAAHVHALGIEHPWAGRATAYCLRRLEHGDIPLDAHDLLCVTRLLERLPDRQAAQTHAVTVAQAVHDSDYFSLYPDPCTYGLGPLHFASNPSSLARQWFDDEVLDPNLDHLESRQQDDGGWPIDWEPPSRASQCEWRAIVTLEAMIVLAAYGRTAT